MDKPYNGMPASALSGVTWLKSRHSNPSGNCVELACLPTGEIAVRDSRHPGGPVLVYTPAEIAAFLRGAKDGEFDPILPLRSAHNGHARRRRPWPRRWRATHRVIQAVNSAVTKGHAKT